MFGGVGAKQTKNARKIIPNLWVWGSNGALALGNTATINSPAQVDSKSTWKTISMGKSGTHAIKTDGTLWAWGLNTNGVLGLGDTTNRSSPVQVGTDTNWSVVSVGGSHSATTQHQAHVLAVKTDGTLWSWGTNINNTNLPSTSSTLGAGRLGLEDTVNRSSPVQVGTDTNWSKVAAGSIYSLALKTDGTLWAWGDNQNSLATVGGQHGTNDAVTQRSSPVQVGTDANWTDIAAGSYGSFGLKNGALYAWGSNVGGVLGLGDTTNRSSPVQVGTDTNWSYITTSRVLVSLATSQYSCAIKTDGTLWAWGNNTSGQLGLGDVTTRSSPVQVGTDTNWSTVHTAGNLVFATKKNGTRWVWGTGQLLRGDNATTSDSKPVQYVSTLWNTIGLGQAHIHGIRTNNTLWSWTGNASGQLALGDAVDRSSAVQVGSDTNWSSVVAGLSHSVAVKSTGSIWTWGANNFAQLGLGDVNVTRSSPVQIGTNTDWSTRTTCGIYHSMAIKTNNTLWAWGYNFFGTLGAGDAGSPTTRSSPIQIGSDTNWSVISCGNYHSVGVKTDGTMYSWGFNSNGQLGLGDVTNRSSPVQIGTDINWSSVTCGYLSFTIALKSTGSIWAWGSNSSGQLGLGDFTNRSSPVQIGTDTTWSKICRTIQSTHVLAIKNDGTLWGWGTNSSGQLGLGDVTTRSSPVQVGTDTNWSEVYAGSSFTLGIKTDNTLWFWGTKGTGNAGIPPPPTSYSSPVQIGTLTNWERVMGTAFHIGGLKRRQASLS